MNRREFIAGNLALLGAAALPGMGVAAGGGSVDDPSAYTHRFAEVNGIRMHYVEAGQGPLVILLHGFPLLWYSWRHQINALAAAGYRVVAPDQRGYGQTSAPNNIEDYDLTQLVGDVVGLINALGETSAVVVGWDIGTYVASYAALLRPDLISAVVLVSSAYTFRTPVTPSTIWKTASTNHVFYQDYFQEVGRAERELEADPHLSMRSALYSLSADAAPGEEWKVFFEPGKTVLDHITDPYARDIANPRQLPEWLSEAAVDYYAAQFRDSGFAPALNWYRNIDRNWKLTSFLTAAPVRQPSLFIGGEKDTSMQWAKAAIDNLETTMPGLRNKVLIPGAAHMAPEETPTEFNAALLDFLRKL